MNVVGLCLAMIALLGVIVFLIVRLNRWSEASDQAERKVPHYDFSRYERVASPRNRHAAPVRPLVTEAMLAEEVWEILARAREPLSARAIRKRMRVRQIIPDHAIPNLDNIGTVIERALEQHPEIEQVTKQRVAMYTLGHRAAVVRAKRRVRPEVVVARATEIEREYRRITVASSESAGYIE